MALPFFHLSQMFKPTMAEDDLKEIKGSTKNVQVSNGKTPIGISKDVAMLRQMGYQAFLVGEALLTADDPAAKLSELRS